MLKRGMCHEQDIQNIIAKLNELEKENAKLKQVEAWKTLATGIHYRKVRNRRRNFNNALGRCNIRTMANEAARTTQC